jgi:hypothetical protein
MTRRDKCRKRQIVKAAMKVEQFAFANVEPNRFI